MRDLFQRLRVSLVRITLADPLGVSVPKFREQVRGLCLWCDKRQLRWRIYL